MARKEPKPSTVKRLFAFSNNVCAAPSCENNLVEGNVVLGEICHIEAAEEGGPRYNEYSDDEYRRSFENLILMCEKCHKIVDSDENKYPPNLLTTWKNESKCNGTKNKTDISDEIISKFIGKLMKQKNENTGSGTQFNNQAETQNIGAQIGTQHNYYNSENKIISEGEYRVVNIELKIKIDKLRDDASPPTEDVIDFKNNLLDKKISKIYSIPAKELKFRKENGRIKAEVESYEKVNGIIDENSKVGQALIESFLSKNDPEKKTVLKQQIKHKGQLQPAIITCDGFLINGNRRKMILEELYDEGLSSFLCK
ncbi:MAG: hypothetical protein OEV42_20885 [Deltaproteobacteria bacterium]|nr:hypothetical protein [Deltaproteobacteria bacterium]